MCEELRQILQLHRSRDRVPGYVWLQGFASPGLVRQIGKQVGEQALIFSVVPGAEAMQGMNL